MRSCPLRGRRAFLCRVRPVLAVGLFLAAYTGCGRPEAPALPLEALQTLEPYGEAGLDAALDRPDVLVMHVDTLTCTTCVNRHIQAMKDWPRIFGAHLSRVTVINDFDPGYLRNLKRIGGVQGPILIETEPVLTPGFHIALYRTGDLAEVAHLALDLNADAALADFETMLKKRYGL